MKKTFSTLMLALVLVAGTMMSCSKNGDKPVVTPPPGGGDTSSNPPPVTSYFIKMKIDGVQQNFTNVAAILQETDEGYGLIVGGAKNDNATEEIDFVISSLEPIAKGEYTEGEHETYYTWGLYAPEDAEEENIFYSGVTLGAAVPYKVKITELTDKVVKGTFSGTFFDSNGQGTNKKVVTEGQFSAQIQE